MSASIFYKPTSFEGTSVPAYAPQAFMAMLKEAFGTEQPTLGAFSVPILRAMKAATDDTQMKKCFDVLLEGIEKHEEIEIYATY